VIGRLYLRLNTTNKHFQHVCSYVSSITDVKTKKCYFCTYLIINNYNSYIIHNDELYEISLTKNKFLSITKIDAEQTHISLTTLDSTKSILKLSTSLFDYINKLEKINLLS